MRAPGSTHRRARALRQDLSLPEKLLWVRLRRREAGIPTFRRQHPIGPYVLDFFCATARLCVEVDGLAHMTADRPERDGRRDAWLESRGVRVVRIAAVDVLKDPDAVADWLRRGAA
ncbi:MAG: DUF559 domain-containing protein [Phenylobacterium sp.]|uniref:endonuclease domain-containing protein n=1 Tax=Phenylobacterium sp. TaxID=1871053 RepID=UPI0025D96D84|nr:endonuclease domain-containing protein [Phenylobacterium sp.]MBI1200088.1 DUF559 domain-containing protein [Phenylobacterium sp.]